MKQISLFDTALVMTNTYKFQSIFKKNKKNFLTNKEVKTKTWCKKSPPNKKYKK